MKALFLASNSSQIDSIQKLIDENSLDIELCIPDNIDHLNQLVKLDGPFSFFLAGSGVNAKEVALLTNEVIKSTGERPFIYIGPQSNFKVVKKYIKIEDKKLSFCEKVDGPDFMISLSDLVNIHFDESDSEMISQKFTQVNSATMKLFSDVHCKVYKVDTTGELEIVNELGLLSSSDITLIDSSEFNTFLLWALKNEGNFLIDSVSINDAFTNSQIRSIYILHQCAKNIGVTESLQRFCDALIQSIMTNSNKMSSLLEIFKTFPQNNFSIASSTLLSCYCANFIAREQEYKPLQVKEILFAIIMSDVALKDETLYNVETLRDSALATAHESSVQNFISHPEDSSEIALKFTNFPDIGYLIKSHHELPSRLGFPNRPLAHEFGKDNALVSLCFIFARLLDGQTFKREVINASISKLDTAYNKGSYKLPIKILKDHFRYLT